MKNIAEHEDSITMIFLLELKRISIAGKKFRETGYQKKKEATHTTARLKSARPH